MVLDDRKYRILRAIIDDYILTAMPVGSRTISRKSGVGFSPATIRNEMSDLEELGYLDQPHTSAGRVPSNKAYRLYVDRLLPISTLSEDERLRIDEHMRARSQQVEEIIRAASRILSDATQYTSVIVAPQSDTLRIQRVQLVLISDTTALMIVVTSAGVVKDAVIRIPEGMTSGHLYAISEMLTAHLHNQPLREVRQIFAQMFRDLGENRRLLGSVMRVMEEKLTQSTDADVIVGGGSNLLHYPEYNDIEKARRFMALLESKEQLAQILNRHGGMEVTIRIGPENGVEALSHCSLVTATYRIGSHGAGTLGVIGPTRMNYARVISVLTYMGQAVSNLLSHE